ncbi:MAG TPA: hypothetical protein PK867_11205 [Pirellulales bacterium]|nr:hypothetical protein [Pirellulales bacterium]
MLRLFRSRLAAVAMVAFLAATVGVPLPSPVRKDRSVAFPCMDRSCGCHDAAGCKEHCCCFSNDEKLVWAAEHHVDPGPFADSSPLAPQAEDGLPRPSSDHQDGLGRPSSDHVRVCESESRSAQGVSGLRRASCCSKQPGRPQSSDRAATKWISIAAYRHCTGLAPLWTLLGAALPPPSMAAYEFEWIPTGDVAQQNCLLIVTSFSPPTPPPRV